MYLSLVSLACLLSSSNVSSIPHGFPLSLNSPNRRGFVWYVVESFCSISWRVIKKKCEFEIAGVTHHDQQRQHKWCISPLSYVVRPWMTNSHLEKGIENFGAKIETQKKLESLYNWSSHWLSHSCRMFCSSKCSMTQNKRAYLIENVWSVLGLTNKQASIQTHPVLLCKRSID